MESNHHSARRQGYSLLSSPVLSVRDEEGGRPDSNRHREDHDLGCLPLHHSHHEAGTTGLEPAASRLTSECSARLSYAPSDEWRGWDSNPRSRAHEAREDSHSSTALVRIWPAGVEPAVSGARSRRGGLLPYSQLTSAAPPAGLEPAASGLRARRHRRSTTGAMKAPAAGIEPALSRVTVARLAARPHRNEKRKERESNPQGRRPTRFRDGIPRRWQSFREWPRQASNLQPTD